MTGCEKREEAISELLSKASQIILRKNGSLWWLTVLGVITRWYLQL